MNLLPISRLTRFSHSPFPYSLFFLQIAVMSSSGETIDVVDPVYPGTAVTRLQNVQKRVKSLTPEELSVDWETVRRSILWAGGLKDLTNVRPGMGYTGHSFNDYNHCDLTAMLGSVAHNNNEGKVAGIAYNNQLGTGIKIASLTELGPGGSWSTCMIGCNKEPPQDVAHIQFKSRIAFKLVWCPPTYSSFVLVDDGGALLNWGSPTGSLPHLSERKRNFATVAGSKYAVEAEKKGSEPMGKSNKQAQHSEMSSGSFQEGILNFLGLTGLFLTWLF
jgi:hypothetical protein